MCDGFDDEGDDVPVSWLQELERITPASKAIAIRWMRSARARLQKKRGKGHGPREVDLEVVEDEAEETYKSGKRSALQRK